MIELILTLIFTFGTDRMHFRTPRRPPPGECRVAAKRADATNLAKIKGTWAEQWARYADLARLERERHRKRED